ncbi:hypothetical protein Ciccas_014135 [Cichlidogyrus casuarinus]|uniref:Vomeronasal type-1 receptor n=1 Tax=Cichlidogyrus casuarinus TaxID=1844966 RepID=A0ABD2PIU8_9PLAT
MFKILAINALISAYSLSELFLKGFKPSEAQVVLLALLLAGSFLFISRAQVRVLVVSLTRTFSKPLKRLSKQRPLGNIFNVYTLLSVFLQFAVHFFVLSTIVHQAESRMPLPQHSHGHNQSNSTGANHTKFDPFEVAKGEFQPSILNTAVYLISTGMQVRSTFSSSLLIYSLEMKQKV